MWDPNNLNLRPAEKQISRNYNSRALNCNRKGFKRLTTDPFYLLAVDTFPPPRAVVVVWVLSLLLR